MNKIFIIISAVVLSGCATGIIASNPNSVIVGNTYIWNQQEAFNMADKECRKHGKNATYIPGPKDGKMEFICE